MLGLIGILGSIELGDLGGTSTVGVGAGIAESLVSTASGLVVAILTLLISNVFRSLYVRQLTQIQEYGGQLELLHHRLADQPNFQQPPSLQEPYANS